MHVHIHTGTHARMQARALMHVHALSQHVRTLATAVHIGCRHVWGRVHDHVRRHARGVPWSGVVCIT